jgi:hypothetical protein
MASGIHKDVWLEACQYSGTTRLGEITYSLEITMNYVVGVEEVKAFSDIR